MDFLKENNFNAIRILFNHESVLKEGKQAQIETTEVRFSPKLFGMSYLQMFEELAKQVTLKWSRDALWEHTPALVTCGT